MRVLLSVFVVALGVAAEFENVGQQFSNLTAEEILNSPDDPPAKFAPIIDKVLDNLQPKIVEILLLSNETRIASGEIIKTIFDCEIQKKIREKKIGELLKKLNHEDKERTLEMSRLVQVVTNQLEDYYPITAKTLITLAMDLLFHEDFLHGSRDVQSRMLWKMVKDFVNKIVTDERILKELFNKQSDDEIEESE